MSGLQCVVNQYTAHACALAMAYGCLVWVGGPRAGVVAQPKMLSRVYTWYIPGISIYLVYTRYILPPQTPIPGILPAIATRMSLLQA